MKNLDTVLRVITYLTSFWLTFYTRMFAYIKLLAKPTAKSLPTFGSQLRHKNTHGPDTTCAQNSTRNPRQQSISNMPLLTVFTWCA